MPGPSGSTPQITSGAGRLRIRSLPAPIGPVAGTAACNVLHNRGLLPSASHLGRNCPLSQPGAFTTNAGRSTIAELHDLQVCSRQGMPALAGHFLAVSPRQALPRRQQRVDSAAAPRPEQRIESHHPTSSAGAGKTDGVSGLRTFRARPNRYHPTYAEKGPRTLDYISIGHTQADRWASIRRRMKAALAFQEPREPRDVSRLHYFTALRMNRNVPSQSGIMITGSKSPA